tara:strand:- start:1178 stop:1363 length:186 start_codon:yes stop_codon:yes gene_type:complete
MSQEEPIEGGSGQEPRPEEQPPEPEVNFDPLSQMMVMNDSKDPTIRPYQRIFQEEEDQEKS